MQTLWLILGSLVLPFVWGWISYRLFAWLWPENRLQGSNHNAHHRPDPLADYQI
jgi:hypothetical protein